MTIIGANSCYAVANTTTWITDNLREQEAKRINTPPISDDSPNDQPGSFFNNNSAGEETRSDMEASPPNTSAGSHLEMRTLKKEAQPSEEWRAAVNPARLTSVTSAKDIAKKQQAQFELNLPEHLPNSPLCPKNPMHKSKGLGICVYHGRTRAASLTGGEGGGEMSGHFGWT